MDDKHVLALFMAVAASKSKKDMFLLDEEDMEKHMVSVMDVAYELFNWWKSCTGDHND